MDFYDGSLGCFYGAQIGPVGNGYKSQQNEEGGKLDLVPENLGRTTYIFIVGHHIGRFGTYPLVN